MKRLWPALAPVVGLAFASSLAAQGDSRPDVFFWAGLLTALVPMLVLGALGGVAVHLYLRERRSREAPGEGEAEERGSA